MQTAVSRYPGLAVWTHDNDQREVGSTRENAHEAGTVPHASCTRGTRDGWIEQPRGRHCRSAPNGQPYRLWPDWAGGSGYPQEDHPPPPHHPDRTDCYL